MRVLLVMWFCAMATVASAALAEDVPFTADAVRERAFALTRTYFKQFQDTQTFVLYGARLSSKDRWTAPTNVKAGKPKPWGYGSRIADTALHCGHTLVALLDANDAAPDPYLQQKARELFAALRFIGGICPVEGLVPRGPHPDDHSAYYDDSSMDQHTTYIIALARYAHSDLATLEDKRWIAKKLGAIGRRLQKHNFSIKAADGVTESHVGFSWKGFRNNHVSILIPTVYALYKGTGDDHWLNLHDELLAERDGLRWQRLHPGEHVELNGHPIYANQNGFRLNTYLGFLEDTEKRRVISSLLAQSAQMQLDRDFPGPFYRKFHSDEEWSELARKYRWNSPNLHGADAAWNLFHPKMLDGKGGLAALSHVRFPLGGYHLVLMSERPEMIRHEMPSIWKMLTTVDLKKISAAETHYLFTTVALHVYAYYVRHPKLFANTAKSAPAFHVSPDGKDNPERDGSTTQSWGTLSYACQRVTTRGATILLHAGVYDDSQQCVLARGVNIKGDGRDVVTIRSSHDDWYLLAESSPVTDGRHSVSGFTLDGQKKTLAHGIRFKGRSNVVIHDVAVRNVDSFGLQIFAAEAPDEKTPPQSYLTGVHVYDCEFQDCGKLFDRGDWSSTCLSIGQLDQADIHDLEITEAVGSAMAFWEHGWFKGTKIHDCDISVTGLNPKWGSEIAIELWHLSDDCEVFDNRVNNWMSFVYGDKGKGRHSIRVHDNAIIFDRTENPKEGIEIGFGLSDVEISSNFIRNAHYGVALWGDKRGWDISHVSIHHNVFFNPRKDYTFGIFISPSPPETYSNISIANNVFDGFSEGIQILNSEGGRVRSTHVRNNIFMNTPHGVLTVGGKKIWDTVVTHNLYDGDHVYFESDGATLNSVVRNNVAGKPDIVGKGKRPQPFYIPSINTANIVRAGTDVGLPYAGTTPDIGPFEYRPPGTR